MQASHFQVGLIALLAVGLGFSIASSQAVGYPAGSVVSYGTNPVRSYGGLLTMDESVALDTTPADQDFIVTDISLMAQSTDVYCLDKIDVSLETDSSTLAAYIVSTGFCYGTSCESDGQAGAQSLTSGIRVPAGETLSLHSSRFTTYTYSGCTGSRVSQIRYTIAGYYTQP